MTTVKEEKPNSVNIDFYRRPNGSKYLDLPFIML